MKSNSGTAAYIRYIGIVVAIMLLLLASCSLELLPNPIDAGNPSDPADGEDPSKPLVMFAGSGDEAKHITTNNSGEPQQYTITVEHGQTDIWRLYFVLSNVSKEANEVPDLEIIELPSGARSGNNIRASALPESRIDASRAHALPHQHLDLPTGEHRHFHDIPPLQRITPRGQPSIAHPYNRILRNDDGAAEGDKEGDTNSFYLPVEAEDFPDEEEKHYVDATARLVTTVGAQKVAFWTPDDVYTGCSSDCLATLLTENDLSKLMNIFIKDGDNNDVYDRMQSLLGDHWGTHRYGNLIASTTQQLDILLYNINDSNYGGGTVGYFWGGNNFQKSSSMLESNERLVLYLHAPWLNIGNAFGATTSQGIQRLKDIYFYTIASTLVHEYQHMIHFYQRFVLQEGMADEIWFNEQLSLAFEDLMSQHIFGSNTNAEDDRGLNGLGSGSYPLCGGRIRDYIFSNSALGLSRWDGTSSDYAVNFSFGAYLLRNYNGVEYLRNVYQSSQKNDRAISDALNKHTPGLSMGDAIIRWGISTLLSDSSSAPNGMKVNNGSSGFFFTDRVSSSSYRLGSINYYNYAIGCIAGRNNTLGALQIFTTTESAARQLSSLSKNSDKGKLIFDGHANIIVAAVENIDGASKFTLTLHNGQAVSVVAKRARTTHNPSFYR